jgi:DNA-binding NtrC family response regulator
VDVRVICATNRDLPQMVRERRFRDDLYYRVSVLTIELPPLRSYKDNLEILAQVFLQQAASKHSRAVSAMSKDAMALLNRYDFPGNVRELKNALEHAVIMTSDEEVRSEHLPMSIRGARAQAESEVARAKSTKATTLADLREAWLAPHERKFLQDLLEATNGNIADSARKAGVNRVTFYRLMQKHGLKMRRTAS